VLILLVSPSDLGDVLLAGDALQVSKLLEAATNSGQLTGALATLTPTETGDLLAPLTGMDLTRALGALTTTQLTGALGTLTPTETGDLLAPLTGGNLSSILGVLTTPQLQSALGTLLPAELASVVDGLTPGQTAGLLTGAGPTQLTGLLAALTPSQLAGPLGTLNPTQLTTIAGALTPAQISGLLGAGATGSVVTGLLGQATSLAGGTPSAPQVDALIAQVTALLGGGLPADPTNLAGLLTTLQPLLGTSGLSPALLTSLLGAANGLLGGAPAPVAAPLQGLVTRITVLLTPVTGGGGSGGGGATPNTAPATTTPTPATTLPRTAGTATRPAAAAPGAQFRAYRAAIGALKLNKQRSSLKFKLTCAATAPKGCLVKVSAKIAGKSVMRTMTLVLLRGKSAPISVSLSKSTTRRLKAKGGSVKITAATALSSLPSATRTLKVKRLKKAVRKAAG
jgi:hypothetical protein